MSSEGGVGKICHQNWQGPGHIGDWCTLLFVPRIGKALEVFAQRTVFLSVKQSSHTPLPTGPAHLSVFKRKLGVLSSTEVLLESFISITCCAFPIVFCEMCSSIVTYNDISVFSLQLPLG